MKWAIIIIMPVVISYLILPSIIRPTEHGLRTYNVIATRYTNPYIGYNIGFEFPTIPYDADDERLFNLFDKYNCGVFEGGGEPGAPLYVGCDGVHDADTANQRLRQLLPGLSRLVQRLPL